LRSRKAEVDQTIESQRASTRFEPDATIPIDPSALQAAEAKSSGPRIAPSTQPKETIQAEPQNTYTSRLLQAKKQVWRDRGLNQDQNPSDE
jgi:hypothetical protein